MPKDQFPITKKSLGQHWLEDEASLDAMLEAASVSSHDTVLEIGPGLGSLTKKLVSKAAKVVAIELDKDLADNLHDRVPASNLEVVKQDILRFNLNDLPKGYKVVANIPYYLTSKLLRTLCESTNPFDKVAILVQREVAERVCAKPGACSLLSISVQFYTEPSLGAIVPAELFTPPPKVDSQILALRYLQEPQFPGVDTKLFFRIVKAGFSQRRKTVLNSLSAGLHLDRNATAELLEKAGVRPDTRAQTLSLDQWYVLYTAVEARHS